jgi:hypothetical protein
MSQDERSTLLALLRFQRASFVRKVTGVSEDAARVVLVASGTTLLWLTKHLARSEAIWVLERFAGQGIEPVPTVGPGDTLAGAIIIYRNTWAMVDAVIEDASLDDLYSADDEAAVNLRWVLMHLLEETARHAGHADILRELIDRSTGR